MSKRIIDVNRRRFLQGAAGFSVALPFLVSLAEGTALGDPIYTRPRRLFWFGTGHGGAYEANMFPDASLLTATEDLFSDHQVSRGALKATRDGDRAVLSPILSAGASALTDTLVGKMNVLRGLDMSFLIQHNTGLHLGNFAANANVNGQGDDGVAQKSPRPTIDQIMAWSPSFYPDVSHIRQRAMVMPSGEALSWNWSDPSKKNGTIQNIRGVDSSLALFNSIFVPADAKKPRRAPLTDRILESYRSLRDGNRRLSTSDRQRLNDHIDRLAELDRKLNVIATCSPATPSDDANAHRKVDVEDAATHWKLFVDVVVTAFICGTSRIAVAGVGATDKLVAYQGDWHGDVAHQWQLPEKQKLLRDSYQHFFERVFLYAAAKLDVEEAPGFTYLDNALMAWSQESSMVTHSSVSIPVVTMGSAGGFFQTGVYADYRNKSSSDARWDPGAGNVTWSGVLYNQWLANVLLAMGVPASEFELWGHKGYGLPLATTSSYAPYLQKHYPDTQSRYFRMASDVLPFLKRG